MQVMAHLQDDLDILAERGRRILRDLRELGDLGPRREPIDGVVGDRRRLDPDPALPEHLDEQRPRERGGVVDLMNPDRGLVADRDRASDREASRPRGADFESAGLPLLGGLDPDVGRHIAEVGDEGNLGRFTRLRAGRRHDVDHVVVNHDRREPRRAAAGTRRRGEQSVVHQDLAGDGLDSRGVDLAGQVVETGERVGGDERTLGVPAGVGVVVVDEKERPVGTGSAPERQIPLRHEDQIPLQNAILADFAPGGRPASETGNPSRGRRSRPRC